MSFFLRFAKTTSVPSLVVGARAVVEGRVVADGGALKVPGTDHDCVYHETLTEEFKPGVRQGRAMWTPVANDEELTPFFVDDGGGSVHVRPAAGGVKVKGGRGERGAGKRRGSRYVTRYIAPGDIVRVRGVVGQPKPNKKGKVRPGLEIVGTDAEPLVILFRKAASS